MATSENLDIQRLNLMYLMTLRAMAQRDPATACSRLGASLDFVQALLKLPITDLEQAAKADQAMFRCALTPKTLSNLIRADDVLRNVFMAVANHQDEEAA